MEQRPNLNIENSSEDKNKRKYPLLDINIDIITNYVDKHYPEDSDYRIALGLYLKTGSVPNKEFEDILTELEEKFKEDTKGKKEDMKFVIQSGINDKTSVYIDPNEIFNWTELINEYIKETGGFIEDFKDEHGNTLTWEEVKKRDSEVLIFETQKFLNFLEIKDFNKEEEAMAYLDSFEEEGGELSDLIDINGKPVTKEYLDRIKKEYIIAKIQKELNEIEKDPSKYRDVPFVNLEEYGDLSLLKRLDGEPLDEKYLNSLYFKNITKSLQKNILEIEKGIAENKKEIIEEIEEYKSLGGKLEELKTADGNPATEAYLNYILKAE